MACLHEAGLEKSFGRQPQTLFIPMSCECLLVKHLGCPDTSLTLVLKKRQLTNGTDKCWGMNLTHIGNKGRANNVSNFRSKLILLFLDNSFLREFLLSEYKTLNIIRFNTQDANFFFLLRPCPWKIHLVCGIEICFKASPD